ATTTVPAPLSSRAISATSAITKSPDHPVTTSEDADAHVQILLRVLPDVADQPFELIRSVVHIVIQLLVVQQLARGPLPLIEIPGQLVEAVGGTVQAVVQLLFGQQLSGGVVAARQAAADLLEVGRRRVERLRQPIVLQEGPEAALAGVDPPRHVVEVGE